MITVSKEDYLNTILEADAEGEKVISATLSHRLSVSAPAVTMALRRLKKEGWVAVHADGRVVLTTAGRKIAQRTVVRHHLIERMLAEVFGMEWYLVHEEAERLEHAVSSRFEAKLAQKLGPAGICPHGNPVMPESPESRHRRGLRLLSEAVPGRIYRVSSIYERDPALLRFLEDCGIRPGTRLRVLQRNYDQTLTLVGAKGKVSLGGPAAEKIWVSAMKAGNMPSTSRAE